MREYRTTRTVIGFAEFMAWIILIGGVIILLVGGSTSRSAFGGGSSLGTMAGAIPGAFITFLGLLGIILCQLGRAGVDTAEMTGKMLINSNEQLRLMKTQVQGKSVVTRPAKEVPAQPKAETLKPKAPTIPVQVHPGVLEYRGKYIQRTPTGIFYGDQKFRSIEEVYDILRIDRAHIPDDFRQPSEVLPIVPKTITHLGREIKPSGEQFAVDGLTFADIEQAKTHIEATTLRAER